MSRRFTSPDRERRHDHRADLRATPRPWRDPRASRGRCASCRCLSDSVERSRDRPVRATVRIGATVLQPMRRHGDPRNVDDSVARRLESSARGAEVQAMTHGPDAAQNMLDRMWKAHSLAQSEIDSAREALAAFLTLIKPEQTDEPTQ